MNALIMNGAEDGSLKAIEAAFLRELEARGFSVTALQMREIKMETCVGCFGCWVKTPGECVINDAGRDVTRKMAQADMLVYLTPVTFGGYSYHLKKAIDRFLPILLPYFRVFEKEIHHPQRYEKRPELVTCGVLGEPDAEQERIFSQLLKRNALNMDPPAYAAEVVYLKQDKEKLSDKIRAMLDSLEVKNA